MTQQHFITPPPELAAKWVAEIYDHPAVPLHSITLELVERAARWGADQELEACCEWFSADRGYHHSVSSDLRAGRRPKPPSLKEQALQALCRFMASEGHEDCTEEEIADDFTTIRRALEQLPDKE